LEHKQLNIAKIYGKLRTGASLLEPAAPAAAGADLSCPSKFPLVRGDVLPADVAVEKAGKRSGGRSSERCANYDGVAMKPGGGPGGGGFMVGREQGGEDE
jgi:hypothetical protein